MDLDNVQLTNTEEVKSLSEYLNEKKKDIQKKTEECAAMGFLEEFGDSKVPEKDKRFYNFVSFGRSDPGVIKEKIETYQKFYEEISAAIPEKIGSEQISCRDLRTKIRQIKEKMSEVYEVAKKEQDETSSSAIYSMHKSFIEEYEKLNWKIEAMDNAALSEMLTSTQIRCREALEELRTLRVDYANISKNYEDINNKYTDINKKYETLKTESKESAKKQDDLIAQNKELTKKVDEIAEVLKKFEKFM